MLISEQIVVCTITSQPFVDTFVGWSGSLFKQHNGYIRGSGYSTVPHFGVRRGWNKTWRPDWALQSVTFLKVSPPPPLLSFGPPSGM